MPPRTRIPPPKPVLEVVDICSMRASWEKPPHSLPVEKYAVSVTVASEANEEEEAKYCQYPTGSLVSEIRSEQALWPAFKTSAVITGLECGVELRVAVAARGAAGWTGYSDASDPARCTGPTSPRRPTLKVVDRNSMRVSWACPESPLPVTHYRVSLTDTHSGESQYCSSRTGQLVADEETDVLDWPGRLTSCLVTGLRCGVELRAQVAAGSLAGWSECSVASEACRCNFPVPVGQPTLELVDRASISMRLSWEAAESPLAVSHYRILVVAEDDAKDETSWCTGCGQYYCSYPAGELVRDAKEVTDWPGRLTSALITGLPDGMEFTARVAGRNEAGWGEYSVPSKSTITGSHARYA